MSATPVVGLIIAERLRQGKEIPKIQDNVSLRRGLGGCESPVWGLYQARSNGILTELLAGLAMAAGSLGGFWTADWRAPILRDVVVIGVRDCHPDQRDDRHLAGTYLRELAAAPDSDRDR